VEAAQEALDVYMPEFERHLDVLLHAKFGLAETREGDRALIDGLFTIMQASHVDFTLLFRRLADLKVDEPGSEETIRDLFIDRAAFDDWAVRYRERLRAEGSQDATRRAAMNRVNPKYILRNYLAQGAIERAQNGDFSEVSKLLAILEQPYDEQPEHEAYAALPPDWAAHLEVSCSS